MKKKLTSKPLYGVLTLFTVTVCCFIAVLSLFSFMRAANEETLSKKRAEAVSAYYSALSEANEMIADVNNGKVLLSEADIFTLRIDLGVQTVEFYTDVNENSRLRSVCEVINGRITKILLRKITD